MGRASKPITVNLMCIITFKTDAFPLKVPLIRGVGGLEYQDSAYLTPLTPLIKGECVRPEHIMST
jgi:hypothetical protein